MMGDKKTADARIGGCGPRIACETWGRKEDHADMRAAAVVPVRDRCGKTLILTSTFFMDLFAFAGGGPDQTWWAIQDSNL